MSKKRNRRIGSIKSELLCKSREAALAAVQIFNNPNISFKAESYIVLMIIAWTYLLHAYYRSQNIEYRYFLLQGKRRKFDRTKKGAYKYWELERCLNDSNSPIDKDTANNLRFLIGLRHEIEHQMTTQIDDLLSARFQACCLNYNHYLKTLFAQNRVPHFAFTLLRTVEPVANNAPAGEPMPLSSASSGMPSINRSNTKPSCVAVGAGDVRPNTSNCTAEPT